jgi:hypothetical protein
MNRRELLRKSAATLAAAGLAGKVETIEADPPPLLLTVSLDRRVPLEVVARIRDAFEELWKGADHPPVVILQPGMTVEAVVDPRAKR